MIRSCIRCGADFDTSGARICADCRQRAKEERRELNPKLTFREMQVVKLVAQAESNKEIAYRLRLSEGTVKEYLWRIFRKTGTANRVALALMFVKEYPTE